MSAQQENTQSNKPIIITDQSTAPAATLKTSLKDLLKKVVNSPVQKHREEVVARRKAAAEAEEAKNPRRESDEWSLRTNPDDPKGERIRVRKAGWFRKSPGETPMDPAAGHVIATPWGLGLPWAKV